jgi:hypothetical protein
LLVFIEKNQISHAVKTILKYLLIIKWRRQYGYNNNNLLNYDHDLNLIINNDMPRLSTSTSSKKIQIIKLIIISW